jgi:hypothetical protein
VQLSESKNKKKRILSSAVIVLMGIVLILNMVNAANINLNTNSKVEYGQGVVLATTCDTFLTLKITREIDSASGNFYAKDLTIGDISTQLHSKRVSITLNDASESKISSSNLYFDVSSTGIVFTSPHATTSSINYLAVSSSGANEVGTSSITFTNIRKQDSSRILADEITRVLIQTSGNGGCTAPVLSCANGGTCAVDDTGPGGGTVIYVSATPITLQGQGRTVTRIEIAPFDWGRPAGDPAFVMCQANVLWRSSGISSNLGFTVPSTELKAEIGYGLKNTNYILSQSYTSGNSCSLTTQAAYKARNANIGNQTDWFLPSIDELNIVCRYANDLDMTSTAPCVTGRLRSDFASSANDTWWSSTLTSNQQMGVIRIKETLPNSPLGRLESPLVNLKSVRPIRMF